MSPRARRISISLFVGLIAVGIALVLIVPRPPSPPVDDADLEVPAAQDGDSAAVDDLETGGQPDQTLEPVVPLQGLRARAPEGGLGDGPGPASIGSLDWREADFLVEFTPYGAGVARITLSDIWETAEAKRAAEEIKERVLADEATLADMPEGMRYVVQRSREFRAQNNETGQWETFTIPAFVARSVTVNGDVVSLYGDVWSQTNADNESATFVTEIVDEKGEPVARLSRTFTVTGKPYDLAVEQTIENLTDQRLQVKWLQYGPSDLDVDRAKYIDRRRARVGHLIEPSRAPANRVFAYDDFLWERSTITGMGGRAMWPVPDEDYEDFRFSWFSVMNRYFSVAVHPLLEGEGPHADLSLEDAFAEIRPYYDGDLDTGGNDTIAYEFESPVLAIEPGASASLDYGVFAGPLDRHILGGQEPYTALNMGDMILYQMSGWCAICTFQWLAHLLLWFLSFGHMVFADWGIGIILLVVVVRLLLHPITKRSQMSMQRFGKAMQKLKPEMDKLQQKYKDEPKRLQAEQVKLWREYGVSPVSMLGCLPMFLQMPIWVALYAMLYFEYDLRHQAAFWGVFQLFWDWPFLGDLSSGDHFFGEFDQPFTFLMWNMTGLNLLPILMGLIFFFQQKYMTPQTATMTKEQEQQQKIMRWMFVLVFPLMLYSAPSGLTLYIMTSSIWGILESRHIRKHINEMDLEKSLKKPAPQKKKKPRDAQARAWQAAMERARAKRQPKPKRYKKRGDG